MKNIGRLILLALTLVAVAGCSSKRPKGFHWRFADRVDDTSGQARTKRPAITDVSLDGQSPFILTAVFTPSLQIAARRSS